MHNNNATRNLIYVRKTSSIMDKTETGKLLCMQKIKSNTNRIMYLVLTVYKTCININT